MITYAQVILSICDSLDRTVVKELRKLGTRYYEQGWEVDEPYFLCSENCGWGMRIKRAPGETMSVSIVLEERPSDWRVSFSCTVRGEKGQVLGAYQATPERCWENIFNEDGIRERWSDLAQIIEDSGLAAWAA
jgi:hypothetical protein